MTTAIRPTATHAPSRRLAAAGIIGRHAGRTVQITRTESGTTGVVLPRPSVPPPAFAPVVFRTARGEQAAEVPVADWQPVDFEVYERLVTASRVAAAADLHLTTEIAYLQRDRQLFEQVAFERSAYELAAGGDR